MMYITISEIHDWLECPWRWAMRHVALRAPVSQVMDARYLGTIFHDCQEAAAAQWLAGNKDIPRSELSWLNSLHLGLEGAAQLLGTEVSPKNKQEAESLAYSASRFWADPLRGGEKILAAEKALPLQLTPGITLLTKLDLIFLDPEQRIWHRQYKTLGARTEAADLVWLQARSLHEAGYAATIQEHYPDHEYGGTDLVIFPKDPVHTQAAGHECEHCKQRGVTRKGYKLKEHHEWFIQRPICVDERRQYIGMYKIRMHANEIYQTRLRLLAEWKSPGPFPDWLRRNDGRECFNPRNTKKFQRCWASEACDQLCSPMDPLEYKFQNPMERYGLDIASQQGINSEQEGSLHVRSSET